MPQTYRGDCKIKHHKKERHQNKITKENNSINSGNATSMIGKNVLTLTFNVDVAYALNFKHNESLSYEIINDRLIIKKGDSHRIDW